MALLITGLIIFFATHLFTAARTQREALITRIGETPYKGLHAAASLVGFVLIIMGFGAAGTSEIYTPPGWGRAVTSLFVLLAFILLVASHLKGHIKAKLRHPMLSGVILWSIGHLLANGDSAGLVLFGSFLLYSIAAIALVNARGPAGEFTPSIKHDLIAAGAGVAGFAVVLYFHGALFGPALF